MYIDMSVDQDRVCLLCPSYYPLFQLCNTLFQLHTPLPLLSAPSLYIYRGPRVLATQSIKARARQRRCMQACTIGLSINEDLKLEKGKEKERQAAPLEVLCDPSVTWL
jgi:hypothetical protein